jgi:hypothetical protein
MARTCDSHSDRSGEPAAVIRSKVNALLNIGANRQNLVAKVGHVSPLQRREWVSGWLLRSLEKRRLGYWWNSQVTVVVYRIARMMTSNQNETKWVVIMYS